MIIKQKDLSKTTKLLWSLAVAIGLGLVILAAIFLFFFVLDAFFRGTLSQPSIKDLLRIIPILIGPPLLVIFAMFRERVGGFLLIIVSLAFIIWFHIWSAGGKWVGFLLGGPFLISGVLFLLSYYSHKKR
jgi:hypothetical protein